MSFGNSNFYKELAVSSPFPTGVNPGHIFPNFHGSKNVGEMVFIEHNAQLALDLYFIRDMVFPKNQDFSIVLLYFI